MKQRESGVDQKIKVTRCSTFKANPLCVIAIDWPEPIHREVKTCLIGSLLSRTLPVQNADRMYRMMVELIVRYSAF